MKYYIKERVFSFGDSFTVKDYTGRDIFKVQGKIFSMGNKLKIYDIHDNEVVYIEQKLFKFLPEYNIFLNGNYAGRVKKEFSIFKPSFYIESTLGDFQIQGDIFAHNFSLIKNGHSIAHICKKYVSFGDSYEIDVIDNEHHAFVIALVIVLDQVLYDNNNRNN